MKSDPGIRRRLFLQRSRILASAAIIAPLALSSGLAQAADDWPTKPVTIIVPFAAGGSTDIVARILARHVSQVTSQTVLVDNRTGGGGTIGVRAVASAAPDGYTFGFTTSSAVNQARVMYKSLPYDPDRDLIVGGAVDTAGLLLTVHNDVPAKHLGELVELGKKQPVNVGSYATGSYTHMFVQQVNKLYGTKFEAIHYKGEAPAMQDLAGGQIQAVIGTYGAARPFFEKGTVRPIGIGGSERIPVLPEVPLFSEAGFKEPIFTVSSGWIGLIAPSGTPAPIIKRMSDLLVEVFNSEEGRQQLHARGLFGPVMDVDAHNAWQQGQGKVTIGLAKELGITLD